MEYLNNLEVEEIEETDCHTIDIYRIINGIYKIMDKPFATLEIEDPTQAYELNEFCQDNNCYYIEGKDDILFCNDTNEPRFFIR